MNSNFLINFYLKDVTNGCLLLIYACAHDESFSNNSLLVLYFFRAEAEAIFHNNLFNFKFTQTIVLQNLLQKDNCKDHKGDLNILKQSRGRLSDSKYGLSKSERCVQITSYKYVKVSATFRNEDSVFSFVQKIMLRK